jgi:hypothetical protein
MSVEMDQASFDELVRRLVELAILELRKRGYFGEASARLH